MFGNFCDIGTDSSRLPGLQLEKKEKGQLHFLNVLVMKKNVGSGSRCLQVYAIRTASS